MKGGAVFLSQFINCQGQGKGEGEDYTLEIQLTSAGYLMCSIPISMAAKFALSQTYQGFPDHASGKTPTCQCRGYQREDLHFFPLPKTETGKPPLREVLLPFFIPSHHLILKSHIAKTFQEASPAKSKGVIMFQNLLLYSCLKTNKLTLVTPVGK